MPVLKVKNNSGEWQDIATANTHMHTMADISDLPLGIVADVEDLKDKVGANSVAYHVDTAIKANKYKHPETHPASIITGLAKVATTGSFSDLTGVPTEFGTGLPEVTESDDGKILGVVDGAWAKVDVPKGGSLSTEKIIEYDFAVSGVPTVKSDNELMDVTAYKISDEVPSLEELQGAIMVQNYGIEGCEDCIATVDIAEAMAANEEVFISKKYNGNMGIYAFSVGYVAGDITVNIQGVEITMTVPESGTYVFYDMGSDPPTNWKFSLTYTKMAGSGLPEVTEDDNGKFLGVVDGVWTKVDAPEGSGGGSQTVIMEE